MSNQNQIKRKRIGSVGYAVTKMKQLITLADASNQHKRNTRVNMNGLEGCSTGNYARN